MMSLETMRTVNARAARQHRGAHPAIFEPGDEVRGVPYIGDRTPRGWRRESIDGEDLIFVDSSGFGSPGEPALTQDEFTVVVNTHPGLGWGIVEAGQFQVYVAAFKRVVRKDGGIGGGL